MIFWGLASCILVHRYFSPEDGDSMFPLNVGMYCTYEYIRRQNHHNSDCRGNLNSHMHFSACCDGNRKSDLASPGMMQGFSKCSKTHSLVINI
jgi:hypothetical protein